MKKLLFFLKRSAAFCALLALPSNAQASTYNNFIFVTVLTDASGTGIGTTPSTPHTTCVGGKIYLKNTSIISPSPSCTGTPMGGVGLQGSIEMYYFSGSTTYYLVPPSYSVTNAPGGTWNYNELLEVPMNIASGTPSRFIYVVYHPAVGEISTSTCVEAPLQDFAYYGRVIALPTIAVSASPATICSGQSSTLTASGASTYSWTPGSMTGSSVSVNPTSTTVYTVSGTSSYGCVGTQNVTVTVNPSPAPHSNTYLLCPVDPWPVLNAGPGTSYSWTYNGSPVSGGSTLNSGFYGYGTYVVTVTNSYGCTGTGTFNVLADHSAVVNANFNYTASTVAGGAQITATAVVTNSANTWELYYSNSSGAAVTYIESTVYSSGGNTHAFSTTVPFNNWYRINHTATNTPCNVPATKSSFFYVSDVHRLHNPNDGSNQGNDFATIDFTVYPNPSSGLVNLKVNSTLDDQPMQFTLLDLTGREVMSNIQVLSGNELQLDLGNYTKGIYLLRAQSGNQQMTTKLVVQ